jgi:hypothetical protein
MGGNMHGSGSLKDDKAYLLMVGKEGGREGGREEGREGGREGGR